MDPSRLLFYGAWGIGVVLVFSVAGFCRWHLWRHHHDRRSFRDFLEVAALWMVAAAACVAVASVVFWPDGSTARGALNLFALGAFLGAGFIMAGDALEQYRRINR